MQPDQAEPPDLPEPSPEPDQGMSSWIRKKLQSIHWRAHATFPNLIRSTRGDEREYLEARDRTQNEATRVPLPEELRQNAVWGVEIFGPREIESLYSQLSKLGWDENPIHRLGKTVTESVREWRTYGFTGNFNIGVVSRNGENRYIRNYSGPVPRGVDYLLVNIIQYTPEITCVLVGFVYDDSSAKEYEQELNTDRRHERRPIFGKFSYSLLGVDHLKRESIDKIRNEARKLVMLWFRKNLRGFFCLTSGGKRLPVTELMTCADSHILSFSNELSTQDKWSDLLIPRGWAEIWESTQYPGFRLMNNGPGDEVPFHTIVTLKTSLLPSEEFTIYGGVNNSTVIAFVHERIDDFFCQNASFFMVHEISRVLKESREKLPTKHTQYRKIIKSIDNIKDFFDRSVGIPVILSEIHERTKTSFQYLWDGCQFMNQPWGGRESIKLSTFMRLSTERLSKRVLLEEKASREHFEQIASILSTRESVKAQRRMEYLTYLTIALAVGSLMVSLSPDLWVIETKKYLAKIFNISNQ